MSRWQKEKRLVLEVAQRMLERGLVVGTSGNVSMRLPRHEGRELLAITPNRRYYDLLTPDDIPVLDFEGDPVEGELIPSVETMLHVGIYRARPKVGAVIHTHSHYASALAVAGMEIPAILDDQVTFLGGEIRLAAYALPGSEELVENVVSTLGDHNAALLPNHGAVGVGRTLREALTSCELVEKTARIYLLSHLLGRVNPLPAEAVEVERAFFSLLESPEKEST